MEYIEGTSNYDAENMFNVDYLVTIPLFLILCGDWRIVLALAIVHLWQPYF